MSYPIHRAPYYDFVEAHETCGAAMERAEQLAGAGAAYSWTHDGQGGRIHRYAGPRGTFSVTHGKHVQVSHGC